MELNSKLISNGHSNLGANALGLPLSPIQGGIHTTTSTQYIATNGVCYETERPTPYGSTVYPRMYGSPSTDEVGNPVAVDGAALRIGAQNHITIDGEISTKGADGAQTGGGSNGSVELSAKILKQSTDSDRTNGGASIST